MQIKDVLWSEARAINRRNEITQLQVLPTSQLPRTNTADPMPESLKVRVTAARTWDSWCDATCAQEVESFPPANFHPRAFITGFDVFHIKCEGVSTDTHVSQSYDSLWNRVPRVLPLRIPPHVASAVADLACRFVARLCVCLCVCAQLASWQSGVRPESLLFSRYMLLSRDLRSQLQAAADDFNCSNVLTQADLVKMQAISPEGHVRPRGGGEGGPNGQHTARKRQRRALQHGQDTGCACAM